MKMSWAYKISRGPRENPGEGSHKLSSRLKVFLGDGYEEISEEAMSDPCP